MPPDSVTATPGPGATPTVTPCACAAIGAPIAAASAAMAKILVRMGNSCPLLELGEPMHRAHDRSLRKSFFSAEFSGNFCGGWNPLGRQASPIPEPAPLEYRPRIDSLPKNSITLKHRLENEMVITSAHIPAIVALIAGILILI